MSYSCPRQDADARQYEIQFIARPDPAEFEDDGVLSGDAFTAVPVLRTVATLRWSEEWTGWQFAARPVTIPWRYTEVGFRIVYRNNVNFAEFSNLFLHKEEFGTTLTYDENANVTNQKNTAALDRKSTYNSHNNKTAAFAIGRLEPLVLSWSENESDTQEKQHLLRKTTSPLGVVSRILYDNDDETDENPKGLPLESRIENRAGSLFIAGKTEYTANKNYTAAQTDARNKTVTTVTDPNLGVVTSVTDPNKEQTPCGFVPRKHTCLQMTGAYPAS